MDLNLERVAGQHYHHPVAHPQGDERVDSSRLSNLQIPADKSNFLLSEDMAALYHRQADFGGNTGLLQGSSRSPSVYMQLAGEEPIVLADSRSSYLVVGEPLVWMLL